MFDRFVDQLCRHVELDFLEAPVITQDGATSFRVDISAGVDAVWVEDPDGTVLQFVPVKPLRTPSRVALQIDHESTISLVAVAHHASCQTARAPAYKNWAAQLEDFDYEANGGIHNATSWSAAQLDRSRPRFSSAGLSLANRTVGFLQQPGLFSPLLFVKCDSVCDPA